MSTVGDEGPTNVTWTSLLVCPKDGGRLRASGTEAPSSGRWSGTLTCGTCQLAFDVEDGIARFLGQGAEALAGHPDKLHEAVARDVGASTYDERMPTYRNRLEIPPTLDALDAQANDVVAELGCGTGRMTILFLETVRHVVAVDFSVASLVRLRERVSPKLRERLYLVHADVARPPLAKGAFSKVASFQVLEHLPSADERQKCIVAARELLREGTGTLTLSVYNWSTWKQYDAKRGRGDNSKKEGHHSTTPPIYYYNFEDGELRELLEGSGFAVQKLRGLILQVPGLLALGRFGAPIHHALAETRFGLRNGHLLLAHARVKT